MHDTFGARDAAFERRWVARGVLARIKPHMGARV